MILCNECQEAVVDPKHHGAGAHYIFEIVDFFLVVFLRMSKTSHFRAGNTYIFQFSEVLDKLKFFQFQFLNIQKEWDLLYTFSY